MVGRLFDSEETGSNQVDRAFLAGWRELRHAPDRVNRRPLLGVRLSGTGADLVFSIRVTGGNPLYAIVDFACGCVRWYEWSGIDPVRSVTSAPVRDLADALWAECHR